MTSDSKISSSLIASTLIVLFFCNTDAIELHAQSVSQDQTPDEIIFSLVQRLDSESLATRNLAEQQLIEAAGQTRLFLSRNTNRTWSSETTWRLRRIQAALFEKELAETTSASRMQISAGSNVEEMLQAAQTRSGNKVAIDLEPGFQSSRDHVGTFWDVLGSLASQNELTIEPDETGVILKKTSTIPRNTVAHSGVLRGEIVSASQLDQVRQIQLRLFWEPRLQPVSVEIPLREMILRDDEGNNWGAYNRNTILSVPPPRNASSVLVRLPVRRMSRRPLAQLDLPVQLVVVGPQAAFSVPDFFFSQNATPAKTGMAVMELARSERQENRLLVQFRTRYDRNRMALPLQSHIDWSRYCSARLQTNAQAIEPVESRQVRQESFAYTIEYTFQLPWESANETSSDEQWDLVFQQPAGILAATETLKFGANGTDNPEDSQ